MDFLAQILNSASNYDLNHLIFRLKIYSAIISVILVIAMVYIIYKLRGVIREDLRLLEGEINAEDEALTVYDKRWQEIKKKLNSVNQSEWKFAVIEADKLVDDVLKSSGIVGDSMGDRLMSIEPGQLRNLDKLWRAHKIRNLLVHDASFDLRRATALEAIDGYESAIRELGAID